MIYVCEHCGIEVEAVEKPDQCTRETIVSGEILGYVSRDMAMDAGEPDMEGMPITGEILGGDICGGQFYMLGEV